MNRHLRSIKKHGHESLEASKDVDARLRDLEQRAWKSYAAIARTLAIPAPEGALDEFLAAHIIPIFSKIGFNGAFIQTLVGLAADAWGLHRFSSEKIVNLYPNMRHDLDEVRKGLLVQADKKMASDSAPAFMTPQASYDIVQQTMDPANLHLLYDEITTPWIILPRAYTALLQEHAHYLPAYLEMIERETNEEALHIFTRIAIEFLANFSIRFAGNQYPPKQVVRLVTAGYTAMFWKSLKSPPRGFEDVRIFEHFLSWLKYSDCHSQNSIPDLAETIRGMEAYKSYIFPSKSDLFSSSRDDPDKSRFLVALRHGCLGIACSLRYFGNTPSVTRSTYATGMEWGTILFALNAFFDLVARRFFAETGRTQYFIRDFLFQLKTANTQILFHETAIPKTYRTSLQFARARIVTMIDQLQQTLAKS